MSPWLYWNQSISILVDTVPISGDFNVNLTFGYVLLLITLEREPYLQMHFGSGPVR